jgi:hypothetical protein
MWNIFFCLFVNSFFLHFPLFSLHFAAPRAAPFLIVPHGTFVRPLRFVRFPFQNAFSFFCPRFFSTKRKSPVKGKFQKQFMNFRQSCVECLRRKARLKNQAATTAKVHKVFLNTP